MDLSLVLRYLGNTVSRGQRARKVLLWMLTISGLFNLVFIYRLNHQQSNMSCSDDFPYSQNPNHSRPAKGVKTILYWNSIFHFDEELPFFFGTGQAPFLEHCPVSNCFATLDKYLMKPTEFDAIIFFYPLLKAYDAPFTYSRVPNQYYVMLTEEAPPMMEEWRTERLDNFFNLTMGYRKDSDVFWPYGEIEKIPGRGEVDMATAIAATHSGPNFAQGKKKLVAWFVSNCHTESKREFYVEQLKKYIPVDVYGACGNMTCRGNADKPDKCHQMLQNDYKFYLSFENSFCRDYVTEKFFDMMKLSIIPIVYGAANYNTIAPPHSYIDATKMGMKKLVALIRELDANDTLYNEYFWWKPYYQVKNQRKDFAPRAMCKLCEILNSPQPAQQVYEDFVSWWDQPNHCHSEYFFPVKQFTFEKVNLNSVKPRRLDYTQD